MLDGALWGSTLPRGGAISQDGAATNVFLRDANCLASDAVGDLVYITGDIVGDRIQVAKADPYNFSKLPVRAIINEKTDSTTCTVYLGGEVSGVLSGLTAGRRYFCGSSGVVSLTPPTGPTARLAQVVGVALSNNVIWFAPQEGVIIKT